MKYYSEKLNKNFDTIEELKEAEAKFEDKESLKKNKADSIEKTLDEKLEEWKEARKKEVLLLSELAELSCELLDVAPERFIKSFKIIGEVKKYEDETPDLFLKGCPTASKFDLKKDDEKVEQEDECADVLEDTLKNVLDFLND